MAYALVTGASNGIGLYLAIELAKKKYDLLLVSRDEGRLKKLKEDWQSKFGISVSFLAIDLSQPLSSEKVINWASAFDVEVLVNNAGFGVWGKVEDNNVKELTSLIQLNQITLTELCKGFISLFKKRAATSYILNVASTASYQAVPWLAVYSASKAYVVSFTRALRWELKDSKIKVCCLSPGTTSTGFMDRANMNDALKQKAEKFTMSPEVVAQIGIRGLFRGKAEIIPGFINWFSVLLINIIPKSITEKIAYNLYKA